MSAGEQRVRLFVALPAPAETIKRPQAETIAAFAHRAVARRFGQWTASAIALMRSEPSPGGSRYTGLAELLFGQAGN